jgi:amidase
VNNWLNQSAYAISEAIHQRRLTCVELMTFSLDHINEHNPAFNAIVSLQEPDVLLAEAHQCDLEIGQGKSRGWLHGIPQAIKDLAATKGIASTRGSPLFASNIPTQDALMVKRMRQAGALLIGKTNTPEFGLGSQTYNPVFGATANAWDPTRTSGGSSGGAAVALALRMLCLADGSDMGGSLRNPAGWNHVYGLRPTQGLVPKWPAADAFFSQLGTEGPMARHAIDLAHLLAIQSGADPRAPLSVKQAPQQFIALFNANNQRPNSMAGLRIGWLGDLNGYLNTEPGVLAGCKQALNRFEALGASIVEPGLSFDPEALWTAWIRIRSALVSLELEPLFDDEVSRLKLKPEAQWEVEHAKRLSASQLMQASAVRTSFYQSWLSYFDHVDVLALPSAQVHPYALDRAWVGSINGKAMDSYHRWMETVIYATMAGSPALSVPAAFWDPVRELVLNEPIDAGALPIGIQMVAAPHQDAQLLGLAHAYEKANEDFMHATPPILRRN